MLTRAHHQRIIRACIYLPTLSAQLEISESLEANMEAEAGLSLGVLAVVAKTKMLREIALRPGDLRPAFHRAEIPTQKRSLGIHILSAAANDGGPREPWTDEVSEWCSAVIQAFSQLEYIAYSFISKQEAQDLNHMETHYLITEEGLIRPSN